MPEGSSTSAGNGQLASTEKKEPQQPLTKTKTTIIAGRPGNIMTETEKQAIARYGRGDAVSLKGIKAKRLKENMRKMEARYRDAALKAQDAEMLLEEQPGFIEAEGMEKTYKFSQKAIRDEIDVATAKKGFELRLPTFGPYAIDYNRSGRDLLLGGRKGHVAAFDWRSSKLHCEINLNETVRDVKWLHNSEFFAVAQKKYVYIYDLMGTEIHCLKKHIDVSHMEFLPYHFLLATVGNAGWLKYQDTSTGALVSEHRTKMGPPTSMTQNPHNAVMHVGHANGKVTMWSPTSSTPLVEMFCHRGPVRALSIDREGRYMATAGQESRVNIWDIRMYKELQSYFMPTPPSSLHISDRGLLAVGWGPHVSIWKDALTQKAQSPYLQHLCPGQMINDVRFCPFEDILGFGHTEGFESLIIPGAGEANFDALEINPYESKKQRKEKEVQTLLNKLQPDMIQLDPTHIGTLRSGARETNQRPPDDEEAQKEKKLDEKLKLKDRQRGKNSSLRRYLRKTASTHIIDERRLKLEAIKSQRKKRDEKNEMSRESLGPALARFYRSDK